MSRLSAFLLAILAFAAGGILFHNPPPPSLPVLTAEEKAVLAEIAASPGPRAEVCDQIIDSVADLLAVEQFSEEAARQD